MPNRIIRENILTSEPVCSLGWADEVFYRRLMSVVDDYGRHEANAQLLRSRCYPLQTDAVRVADISRSMAACQSAGLIVLYESNGKQYLELQKFGQQTRSPSKHPPPPDDARKPLLTIDSKCSQTLANAHLVGDVSEVVVDKEPTVLVDGKPSTPAEPIDRVDCPMQAIADAWNAVAVSMPAVKSVAEWPEPRKRAVKARWVDRLKLKKYTDRATGLDYWTRLFERVEGSDFLAGRTGGTFSATLDWVMNPTNLAKIIENGYPNRQAVTA